MKISFEACVRCLTIPQLILKAILKTIQSSPSKAFSDQASVTKSNLKSILSK